MTSDVLSAPRPSVVVYGGARLGVGVFGCGVSAGGAPVLRCVRWCVCSLVVVERLLFLRLWARRVCLRLWTTAAMSAASVWAARPNTRQVSFSRYHSRGLPTRK